jgi:nucleoside-diphosphate-sugar epimerase
LNPSCVYGPRGATYSELPAMLAPGGGFCWVDGGAGRANYTYISNVIDAMLLSAANPAAHGERFLINDGTTSWRDFLAPVLEPWLDSIGSFSPSELKQLERDRRPGLNQTLRSLAGSAELRDILRKTSLGTTAGKLVRRVAPAVLDLKQNGAGGFAATVAPAAGSPPCWLAELFPNRATSFSSEKASRILGWTPRVDLAEGQRRVIEYLVANGLRPALVEEAVCVA